MDVRVVLSWPSPLIAEWRAHFELQIDDRENPPVDDEALKDKITRTFRKADA